MSKHSKHPRMQAFSQRPISQDGKQYQGTKNNAQSMIGGTNVKI